MKARENPFSTRRVAQALRFDPQLIGTDWEGLMARWHELGRRACVIGRHGAGKTSFLDAFAEQVEQPVVRFFFNRAEARLTAEHRVRMRHGEDAVWLVDGDGHLSLRDRWEFARHSRAAAGLLCARHQRRGMKVLVHLRADLELAGRLLHRLDPDDRYGLAEELPGRFVRCRGNLRELWFDCYDAMARRSRA